MNEVELLQHCKDENNNEPNDFDFAQIEEFAKKHEDKLILIPDTLGTFLALNDDIISFGPDSLIRIRDVNSPCSSVMDRL